MRQVGDSTTAQPWRCKGSGMKQKAQGTRGIEVDDDDLGRMEYMANRRQKDQKIKKGGGFKTSVSSCCEQSVYEV